MSLSTTIENATNWPQTIRDAVGYILTMASKEASQNNQSQETEIAVAAAGDDDAFAKLVKKYQGTITQQMHKFSRDCTVVEELVHDVFIEAFMSLNSFRGKSPFVHWLRKIAVRVGYRYWKRQVKEKGKVRLFSDDEQYAEVATSISQGYATDAMDELHRVFGMLAPRDRLVLTLIYWDGCSIAEAAKLSGWTKTMVKVQAHRAKKRLRKLIEESKE